MNLNTNKLRKKNSLVKYSIVVILIVLISIIPSFLLVVVKAEESNQIFRDSFPLQQYDCRFYLVYLEENDSIQINVTNTYNGDFDIFLHNARPIDTYLSEEGYDPKIYSNAVAWDINPGDFASINYTSENSTIYYIQVALVKGDFDTFHLNSTRQLELYFIPFLIPSYSTSILIFISIVSMAVLIKINKVKIKIKIK